MDYNRTVMRDPTDPRARLRLILTTIILFTIPCYCVGGIALMLAPGPGELVNATFTPTASDDGQHHLPSHAQHHAVFTASVTPTLHPLSRPTWTATLTLTPFVPPSWTPSAYLDTPSLTATWTPSPTNTWTPSPTETQTPTPSLTPLP